MDYDSQSNDTDVVRYIVESESTKPSLGRDGIKYDQRAPSAYSCLSDSFDTDLEEDFPPRVQPLLNLQQLYAVHCREFCVVPCSSFVRSIFKDEIDISHYNIGPKGCRAVAKTMKQNTTTTLLNISDNGVETEGAIAIAELLQENFFLTVVDMSMNSIGKQGIEALCSMLNNNKYLQELSLASNKINDKTVRSIANALKENSTLRVLDLGTNDIGSDGGAILAAAVQANGGLFYLNLGGNFIRRKGAVQLLEAIEANDTLRSVDLSFNGLDVYAANAIESLLKRNTTLKELDISHNRLSSETAQNIAVGLEKNTVLRVLKVGWNPLQSAGAKMIVDGITGSDVTVLEELYLDDIPVTGEFEDALENLFDTTPGVYVQFGTRVRGKGHRKRKKEQKDLVSRILDYIEFRGIRMMDFFRRMDKSGKMMITKEQFRKGLQTAEIPMSGSQLNKLFSLLDENGTGFARYRDFAKHFFVKAVDQIHLSAMLASLSKINEAIENGDPAVILACLQLPTAKLNNVRQKNAELYSIILRQAKKEKAERLNEAGVELWHEEIQQCVDKANMIAEDGERLSLGVLTINETIDKGDSADLLLALKHKNVALRSVTPECAQQYRDGLKEAKDRKDDPSWNGWTEHRLPQLYTYYHNVLTKDSCWKTPADYNPAIGHLNREEIQAIVSQLTTDHDRDVYLRANEPSVVKIQSQWKGHQARKAYNERKHFLNEQQPAAVKIQAAWKGHAQRRKYLQRRDELEGDMNAILKIQSIARMYLARKKYLSRLQFFKDHINDIVKIQAFLRANMAHHDYKQLVALKDPPARTVRKFLHLLENDHIDFSEELELQNLKAQVVTDIRSLSKIENDLNTMDIKIGLLVKNRITLQDVVMHGKKLKREKGDIAKATQATSGIKSLSKEKREMLEGYQHLFYLLQTNPSYLAKLIFKMPQSKTTKFMESVILTLYNYASNSREDYLLLKLFETALREEIASKVDQIVEIITGNPTVIKMVVHFNRGQKGQSSLRDILQPLVKEILDDKSLSIHTSPVDVYKQWINQTETETGKPSELPYDVDNETAMKHPEVVAKVEASIKCLQVAADKFLNSIIKSTDLIPYGMKYVAMTLREALSEKFPQAGEDDILKVVGNLIYYRYMNPAIVAPDAFDIVDLSVDRGLTSDQRRNLGSIAKVLQYAASNKMFGGENAHLSSLNPYIAQAFNKFRNFFRATSQVEDAEAHFGIDQYSDITMLAKPVVYITVQEIIDTHQLLHEHMDSLAPDEDDPLRDILSDIGEVPTVEDMIGGVKAVDGEDNEQQLARMAKTEISLTLTNKFEVPDDDDSDIKALFVRTKKLIVEVMRVQHAETLVQILETTSNSEQEAEHQRIMKQRESIDKTKQASIRRSASVHGESRLPLEDIKKKIWRNLKLLEAQGLVTAKNDYQDIVNAIAKDIRNQRRYRQRRKQELKKLKETVDNLNRKEKFYEEQIDYYNQYIKVCLDNLAKKKNTKAKAKKGKKEEKIVKGSIKYSGQKLYEKGVILEIEGLPQTQFKNVLFEITAGDEIGLFQVSARFMGVAMEKVELVFQDLLQLQYEGIAVMKMFGKAKINVNLLIFLVNKKFYGK
eukprot:gene6087-11472_t